MRNVYLLGMMGAGKSYWAQRLSATYKIDWADLDAEVEKETMLSISEIFDTEGEAYFRQQESMVLKKLSAITQMIISTGGGTPCFNNNMQWMNSHGITIWIDEPVDILAARLEKEKAHRPLIRRLPPDTLQEFLSAKLEERQVYYSQAHHHLQGTAISGESFALILQQYE